MFRHQFLPSYPLHLLLAPNRAARFDRAATAPRGDRPTSAASSPVPPPAAAGWRMIPATDATARTGA